MSQKKLIEDLRVQWKKLWLEHLNDKVRAEGVATKEYSSLFVEQGTVIKASKDYKALNFREIVEQYNVSNMDRYIPPSPQVGGWNKFVKTSILRKSKQKKRFFVFPLSSKKEKQQTKKGGRGWIHH